MCAAVGWEMGGRFVYVVRDTHAFAFVFFIVVRALSIIEVG